MQWSSQIIVNNKSSSKITQIIVITQIMIITIVITQIHHPNSSTTSTPSEKPQRLHISKTHGRPSRTSNLRSVSRIKPPNLSLEIKATIHRSMKNLISSKVLLTFLLRYFFWKLCFFCFYSQLFHLYMKNKKNTLDFLLSPKKKSSSKNPNPLSQPSDFPPAIRIDPLRTMDST